MDKQAFEIKATHQEIEILIVEDEEMWLNTLCDSLDDFGYKVSGFTDTFEGAVDLLNTHTYDIALVDINLNNRNSGIELGKMLNKIYHIPYIFITAEQSRQIISDAVAAKPSAYLTKPFTPASLIGNIQSAINNFELKLSPSQETKPEDQNYFFLKQRGKYIRIEWKDIIYLRSETKYTCIFNVADKTEYYIRSTLTKTMQFILPTHLHSKFIQVNRGEIVQMDYIAEIAGDEVKTAYKTFYATDIFEKELKTRAIFLG